MAKVTIRVFAEITRRVISRDGFEGYLPTACFPERRVVAVLEGVPDDADVEKVALKWAAGKSVGTEEYFVAFKVNATQFKVVRVAGGDSEEAVFDAIPAQEGD